MPSGVLIVTKKEIVRQISERIGMTQLKTKEIVQLTFDAIVDTLLEDKRIELRNFGVFEVKQRKARKNVDTKASKGRKLRCVHFSASCDAMSTSIMLIDKPDRRIRYDVHEKVQNFMVPVPFVGGGWHEAQIDELFASLLGKGFGDAQPVDQMMADDAAESRDILELYHKWFIRRTPTGEQLNLPMSPQLEEIFRMLGQPD